MPIVPSLYHFISRSFDNDTVKDLKDVLRPVKHALVGPKGIYQVIELVREQKAKERQEISTVFDIGAAVGDTARPLLKNFPNATVYCFEPLPASFERLKERTAAYRDRAKLFNYGFYNKNGDIDFYVSEHAESSSINLFDPNHKGKEIRKVNVRRLDDVVQELGVTHIDFMKIDVEAAEKELLEGAEETLKITDAILVEIVPSRKGAHNHDYIDVFEYLHRAGFILTGVIGDFFFTKIK